MPVNIRENYNITHLSWMKTGGAAQYFCKATSMQELCALISENRDKHKITIIGNGSNILIDDAGIEGIVIKLSRGFNDINIKNDKYLEVGAACLNYNLARFCMENSIAGFEFLVGIPGSVGGGAFMNAGAYGSEFSQIIEAVEIVQNCGKSQLIEKKDLKFAYRESFFPKGAIITKVFFKLMEGSEPQIRSLMQKIKDERSKTQPIKEKTSGSTFKNPENHKAWKLIDNVGLRGARSGGAMFSQMHCNFIINEADARSSDIKNLCNIAVEKVYNAHGIRLQREIKFLS